MAKTTAKNDIEEWLDTIDPSATPARDGRHLRAVGAALSALEQAEHELRQAIDEAHEAGDSWDAIGLVLGTSRQGAHRKYAHKKDG